MPKDNTSGMQRGEEDLGWRVPMGFAASLWLHSCLEAARLLDDLPRWPRRRHLRPRMDRRGKRMDGSECGRRCDQAAARSVAGQRRQTEFAPGYAPATLSATHVKNGLEDAVIHIVNWKSQPTSLTSGWMLAGWRPGCRSPELTSQASNWHAIRVRRPSKALCA